MTAQELRDPYTVLHQWRVARLAGAIALQLDLSAGERDCVTIAAQLHDVGKLQVPIGISAKFGLLGVPEIQLIQRHPLSGFEILRPINFGQPVAQVVLQHHEHPDGSGYPYGLLSDSIRIEAKIIAVADTVEAMLSHRPYRPAFDRSAVIRELRRGQGTLYDAAAVAVCLSLLSIENSEDQLFGGSSERYLQNHSSQTSSPADESPPRAASPAVRLTLQQTAVLQLLAEGCSVKQVARRLNIAIGTVKTHISHAYAALGTNNRIQAVSRAGFRLDASTQENAEPFRAFAQQITGSI